MGSKGVNQQVLDKLKVERERGITGKLQRVVRMKLSIDHESSQGTNCEVGHTKPFSGMTLVALTGPSMFYQQDNMRYLLNLIDTPVCGTPFSFVACHLNCPQRVTLTSHGRCLVRWLPVKVHFYLSMQVKVSKRSPCQYFTLHGKEVLR